MSFDTARKIVDFAFATHHPGHKLRFHFFGGEPLLCFSLMKDIVGYIRQQENRFQIPVSFSMTSNGTILNQLILNFLRDEGIDLCISLDGPAHVHDLNRRYKDGRRSFVVVMSNLQKALDSLESVQINAVYGPQTISLLPESVRFFISAGVPVIHLNPNIEAIWPPNLDAPLHDAFTDIAQAYIESYERGNEIAISGIDSKIILFFKGGYGIEDLCCMGEGELAFAPSGNVYPCERFIGEDDNSPMCFGNIDSGIDIARRCSLLKRRGNRNEECKTCGLRRYCMNWCGCTNYAMTGHTDLVGSAMCAIERATIDAARQVSLALTERNNQLFIDHFTHYFDRKPQPV